MNELPLGRASEYPDTYTPDLLFPVPRAEGRAALGLPEPLPFTGSDLWTAWEMSWLDNGGRPVVAVLRLAVPADSPSLIESKSLKLYLNSFSMSRYANSAEVQAALLKDLSAAAGSKVDVLIDTATTGAHIHDLPGECIDREDTACEDYDANADLLKASGDVVSETLHSHVLRSLCPVTGQPDSGSVLIRYRGPRIERAALLRYLVSFRRHCDFHELCVERIFMDLQKHCGAKELTVYARYNRRGGIDINPFRSNVETEVPDLRLWRQ
jgi:7-cyano-7-deazaguanine reductase